MDSISHWGMFNQDVDNAIGGFSETPTQTNETRKAFEQWKAQEGWVEVGYAPDELTVWQAATAAAEAKYLPVIEKLAEALLPPEGYRISTVDNSIDRRCSVMFKLIPELEKDWHLQGEVLNAAGEDIRIPLYITRETKVNLGEILALAAPLLKGE